MSALCPLWAGLRALCAKNLVNVHVKYPGQDAARGAHGPPEEAKRGTIPRGTPEVGTLAGRYSAANNPPST